MFFGVSVFPFYEGVSKFVTLHDNVCIGVVFLNLYVDMGCCVSGGLLPVMRTVRRVSV